MSVFAPKITTIKGISERRRLPRLGRIRLGIKVPNKGKDPNSCECKGIGCFKCTHPIETPYFVVPKEVSAIYGERSIELDIMAPVNDLDVVFPHAYKWYGSSRGLKCTGNLEIAFRMNEETRTMEQRECPCEHKDKDCNPSAALQVILYKVNFGGVYQITSGSFNSMVDIPSGFDFTQALLGRFAMVPLKLKRIPTETHHDGKKQIHYPLRVQLETNSPEFINALREQTNKVLLASQYALPPAEEIRPDLDGPINAEWKEAEEEQEKEQPKQEQKKSPELEKSNEKEDFKSTMERERNRLGNETYLKIIDNNGFENVEQITNRKDQVAIYKIMAGYPTPRDPGQEG